MAAKIIAFLNFKGGVGKTTCVVNLGACLAYLLGRRVLVADLDAQCNSTFWLLRPREFQRLAGEDPGSADAPGRRRTTWQIYEDALRGTRDFDPAAAIVRGVPRNEHGTELAPFLHLLPAATDLLDVEFGLDGSNVRRLRPALHRALEPLRGEYDFILLDCPPHLHYVTQSAVLAADHLVVPYNPDYLSLSGFKVLCRELRRREEIFRELRPGRPPAQVAAAVVCRHKRVGNVYQGAIAELDSLIDQLRERGLVHPACARLEPPIRDDVRVGEAASEHRPVIHHAPKSIASDDFMALALAFTRHFNALP